ncbi:LacI family DNA-binding transcriptional regulator [Humibacter ginsenosidimutans]|nr:substrate-binding domain-containing protein [Humibacter ginsenosidimutans]
MSAASVGPAVIGMAFVRSPSGVDPFYSEIIAGMEDTVHPRGMQVLMQTVPSQADELAVYRHWVSAGIVAGIALSDLTVDDSRGPLLNELGVPHVTLGEPTDAAGGAVVRVDNAAATVRAVHELADLGHRLIGRVSGPERLVHTQSRTAAFADAMAAVGGTAFTAVGDYSPESGAAGLRLLLSGAERPTAIIFDNDVMAVAGLEEAARLGVRVPEELSVVAWDDSTLCRLATPMLSAMSHDVRELGGLAAEALLTVIDGGQPQDVTAPLAEFVARGSTAALSEPSSV